MAERGSDAETSGDAWRKLEARDSDAETSGGAWGSVGGPMKTKFHRKGDRRDFFPMVQSVV